MLVGPEPSISTVLCLRAIFCFLLGSGLEAQANQSLIPNSDRVWRHAQPLAGDKANIYYGQLTCSNRMYLCQATYKLRRYIQTAPIFPASMIQWLYIAFGSFVNCIAIFFAKHGSCDMEWMSPSHFYCMSPNLQIGRELQIQQAVFRVHGLPCCTQLVCMWLSIHHFWSFFPCISTSKEVTYLMYMCRRWTAMAIYLRHRCVEGKQP